MKPAKLTVEQTDENPPWFRCNFMPITEGKGTRINYRGDWKTTREEALWSTLQKITPNQLFLVLIDQGVLREVVVQPKARSSTPITPEG